MGTENCLTKKLLDAKIKELPDNFYASVTIGDYYIYVHVIQPPVVYVEKKEGCGRTTTVKFVDPNPEVAVGELFARAKELIEAAINCS